MQLIAIIEKELAPFTEQPKKLQIEKIEIVTKKILNNANDSACFLGEDLSNEGRPFITKTHFKLNGYFCIPAFELIPEGEENLREFSVDFCADEGNTKVYSFERDSKTGLFLDYPKGSYIKVLDNNNIWHGKWKFNYNNGADTGALGAVQPGYTKILLKKNELLYDNKVRELLVLPSSISFEQLETMIKEVMFIRRELVFLKNKNMKKAKTYFGLEKDDVNDYNWELQLRWITNCLNRIEPHLIRVNSMPRTGLKKRSEFKQFCQIKKITPLILEQYMKDQSRRKYMTKNDVVSFDIYEHRLLKNKLIELKKFVQEQNVQNIMSVNETEENIISQMVQLLDKEYDYSKTIKFEDIETEWKAYREPIFNTIRKWELDYKKEFDSVMTSNNNGELSGTDCESADKTVMFDFALEFQKIWPPKVNIRNNRFCIDFDPIRDRYAPLKYINSGCYIIHNNEKIYLMNRFSMISNESKSLLTFYKNIIMATKNKSDESAITVKIKGYASANKFKNDNKFDRLEIYKIDRILLNDQTIDFIDNSQDATKELREIYIDESINRNLFLKDTILKQNNIIALEHGLLNNQKKLMVNLDCYSDIVVKKIEKFLSFALFKDISGNEKQTWRMTQIFTNDSNYNYIYRMLHLLDKICDFSFSSDGEKILHEKVDKIYEYWILSKILEKLILKQKWETENNDDIIKVFNNFFDRKNSWNLQKVRLKKYGDEERRTFTMDIFYDTELGESLSDLINPTITNKRYSDKLRPDYLFRVKDETGTDIIFILDAKYRDYSNMGERYWIDEDLKKVCVEKYIERPLRDLKIDNIATAFIVHTDITPGNKENNTNQFLGKYVTYNAFSNSKVSIPIVSGKDGSKCQVGSFYLVPYVQNIYNQSGNNLDTFFKMVFEYFLDAWEERCWQCGSKNIKVTTLFTGGGYPKYHMRCCECDSFWVKNHCYNSRCHSPIIKHMINYHIEQEYGSTWKLLCPSCGSK